jgi:hypothetical protein
MPMFMASAKNAHRFGEKRKPTTKKSLNHFEFQSTLPHLLLSCGIIIRIHNGALVSKFMQRGAREGIKYNEIADVCERGACGD